MAEPISSLPPPSATARRLDSWKEVAEYLGRDVRTVMRWSKSHALPVRRVAGGKGRSVFAFTNEIDAWLEGNTPNGTGSQAKTVADIPAAELPARPRAWRAPAAALVAIVLAIAGYLGVQPGALDVATLRPEMTEAAVLVRDAQGRSRPIHQFDSARPAQATLAVPRLHDADSDGRQDVMAGVAFYLGARDRPTSAGELLNISLDGAIRWRFAFDDQLAFRGEQFTGPWGLADWDIGPAASPAHVAVAAHDMAWWASVVAVLDHNGKRLGTFVNPGWIESLLWIDGARVLAGGFNNQRDAAVIALLDANRLEGQAPGTTGTEYECVSCPRRDPLLYASFPRSEINLVTASRFNRAQVALAGDRYLVTTSELVSEGVSATAMYEFDRDMRLVRARYSDTYWDQHRRLELEGRLTHSRETCAEREGPAAIHVWSGSSWTKTSAPR